MFASAIALLLAFSARAEKQTLNLFIWSEYIDPAVVADFEKHLKIPSVMMGFGLPDDNLHAPNEKFHIPNFHRGIESIIRFLQKVGEA